MKKAQQDIIISLCKKAVVDEMQIPAKDILGGVLSDYYSYCYVEFAIFNCHGGYADRVMVCYYKTEKAVKSMAYFKPTIQKTF